MPWHLLKRPLIGSFVGSFIGDTLGTLVGDLFEGPPKAEASFAAINGSVVLSHLFAKNGGSTQLVSSLANASATEINTIVGQTGAQVASIPGPFDGAGFLQENGNITTFMPGGGLSIVGASSPQSGLTHLVDQVSLNALQNASGPDGQTFVFPVTIAIDRNTFNIGEQSIPLSAGMSVTVEIKTDTQRIIGYLLTPLATMVSSSMHER